MTNSRLHKPPHFIVWAVAIICMVVAVAVLAGWWLNIPWLRAPLPNQVSMKSNTALGFFVAGLLLLVASRPAPVPGLRWGLELLLLSLSLLTLVQYLFGVSLGLDQLLVEAPTEILTSAPGRMAPTTALGFLLFAIAMLADHWGAGVSRGVSRTSATLLFILALTSLLGYAYGAPTLYLGIDSVTAMALTTALLFAALAIGTIWLRSAYGLPAMLAEHSAVGSQVRALFPIIVAVPLLVGAAVASGYGYFYEGEFAIALTSLGSVIAGGLVAMVSVVILRRADNALQVRERALAAATNGIVITDHRMPDEPIIFVNTAFTDITGYRADEVLGRNCRLLNHDIDNEPDAMAELRRCVAEGIDGRFEFKNRRKDGRAFWNRLSLAPIENYEGRVTHFVGVIDDITQEREQQARLQQALADAKAANAMRDTFVRLVSHELRTPLNAALTWARLIEVDHRPETVEKGLKVIAHSIESQSRLIDDLVDVTRFRTIGVRLEPETVDARELIELTIEELRPMIEPDLALNVHFDGGDYTATADKLRLQQVVRNLLSNAGKYTAAGGRIDVAVTRMASGLELRVADTGKGLTGEEEKRVFEPFWRADNNLPGLGVGLSIVKALVAAHEGTITVDSAGPGKGTAFTVRLPFDASLGEHAPLRDQQPDSPAPSGPSQGQS